MLVLAALWWAWGVYAWLTSAMDVDEGGVRLAMLAAMGAMFGVALAVPGAFGDDAVLFGAAYFLVRLLHLVLSAIVVRDDADRRGALLRFAPTAMFGASLILFAGFLDGRVRIAVWLAALAIDYLGPAVVGVGRGWRVAPEHFAERYGLIILIALGESIIAIGLGLVSSSTLVSSPRRRSGSSSSRLSGGSTSTWQRSLREDASCGRPDSSYTGSPCTHTATSICRWSPASCSSRSAQDDGRRRRRTAPRRPGRRPVWWAALYLLAHVAFLFRTTGRIFRRRSFGALALLALVPAALAIPALAALGLVSAVCAAVVAWEVVRYRESRVHVRHPELVTSSPILASAHIPPDPPPHSRSSDNAPLLSPLLHSFPPPDLPRLLTLLPDHPSPPPPHPLPPTPSRRRRRSTIAFYD